MVQVIALATGVVGAPRRGEVLLIEDRNDVREGLAQLLELHGYMVTDVPNADQGWRELLAHPHDFALIVLDLLLPGALNGVGFRACQLADPEVATVPMIIITASDVDPDERLRLRADGWLDKPFRFDRLQELVTRYVIPEGQGLIAVGE
jgi:DNA-binding response OmpR family regulator